MGSTLDALDDLFADLLADLLVDLNNINIDHATNERFAFYSQ